MLPPACTTCGAPLPTVPADPAHPERCPACAARAVGAPGPTAVVPPPPPGGWGPTPQPLTSQLVVADRIPEGILVGAAAATIGGVIWWAVVASTHHEIYYLALLIGLLTGQGVLVGARKGGVAQAVLAGVFTLAAMAVAQYFVERSLAISAGGGNLPLWQGFGFARSVVSDRLHHDAIVPLLWALSVVAAAASAGGSSRRPAIT